MSLEDLLAAENAVPHPLWHYVVAYAALAVVLLVMWRGSRKQKGE